MRKLRVREVKPLKKNRTRGIKAGKYRTCSETRLAGKEDVCRGLVCV